MPLSTRDKRTIGFALGGVLALLLLVLILTERARAYHGAPPLAGAPVEPDSEPRRPPRTPAAMAAASASSPVHPSGVVGAGGLDPAAQKNASPEQLFAARMAETRAALLQKFRYPDESQPLAKKPDLLLPHHAEPVFRGLGGAAGPGGSKDPAGKVQITQRQDRLFLMPGQNAVASFQAMNGDAPASVNITRSELSREGTDTTPVKVVGTPTFLDNGVPPDEVAGDGIWSATVVTPSDGVASQLTLFVDLESTGEKGTLAFPFIQTVSAPARFTKTARSALEEGSVAYYVGIQIDRPGLYEIIARVYDSTGAPMAYCRFLGQLSEASREVRLLAFGKLLLDEGAAPPLVLRDVEGHRMVFGQHPDRELMDDWAAGVKSIPFDSKALSGADYQGPDKAQRISDLDKATADGLANVHTTGSPAPPPSH